MDEDDEDRSRHLADISVTPWNLLGSTLGNALYSKLTLAEVWACYNESLSLEQFDAAVEAMATLREIEIESRQNGR